MAEKKIFNPFRMLLLLTVFAAGWLMFGPVCSRAVAGESKMSLEQILDRLEKKYTGASFSAKFFQESTIKAMEISDHASGKVYVRHPGKMRWEYEKPDRQIIITDGFKLWIYRPDDNQVMAGSAPEFFRDGKGASFLSDINLIRKKFEISFVEPGNDLYYDLKLIPLEKTLDVSDIQVSISKNTFNIVRVATLNFYGDKTQIEFLNTRFKEGLDDSLFSFEIPEGVDVLKMQE
jgi:outer membrane lipoprotein carrier protein